MPLRRQHLYDAECLPELFIGTCPPKSRWPELVGKTAEEAQAVVEAEAPDAKVQVCHREAIILADTASNGVWQLSLGGDRAAASRR
jgi:hypothetical protein